MVIPLPDFSVLSDPPDAGFPEVDRDVLFSVASLSFADALLLPLVSATAGFSRLLFTPLIEASNAEMKALQSL